MTIHRGVGQLGLTSCAQGKRHLLTNRMNKVFLNRCRKLLNWVKANGSVIEFFCDERIFPVDRAFCGWNGHCIISSSKEVHHTMTTNYPAGIMAISMVASEVNLLNRFFAEQTKCNATDYCKVLWDKIIHWTKDKAAGGASVI